MSKNILPKRRLLFESTISLDPRAQGNLYLYENDMDIYTGITVCIYLVLKQQIIEKIERLIKQAS